MSWKNLGFLIVFFLVGCDKSPLNYPHQGSEFQKNVRFSSFSAPPKTLDPARSYSSNESLFTAQIYESPVEFHYLKRPYTLIPLTAQSLPKVTFYGHQGQILQSDADAQDVAFSVYEIKIKPNIYYQPHPAFAKDLQGNYYYHHLPKEKILPLDELSDFKHTGTRELTAEDYVYEIKRLAHPEVNSPIYGLMENYILGLKEFGQKLTAQLKKQKGGYLDLRTISLPGAQTLDRYTYRIIIKGKYPQFIYWLAMSFFSPIPWEADLFYSQAGMKENNFTFDWYPVGTGPYYLAKNNPNSEMRLKSNPYFHPDFYPSEGEPGDAEAGLLKFAGKRLPLIKEVIYSLEKEYMPRWNKFLQGYYDVSTVSSDNFDQAIQMDQQGKLYLTPLLQEKGVTLQSTVSPALRYLGFNMLDDVVGGKTEQARKLRLAIALAIDYEEFIQIFLNGRGVVAQGPIPPGIFGYETGQQGLNPYLYEWRDGAAHKKSLEVAKKLLAEAGYPGGRDPKTGRPLVLNYDISISGDPDEKALFNWERKQFAKLGIQLNIRGTEYNRFQEKIRTGQTQIFLWGWVADYPDPENFLFLLYGPNSKVLFKGENAANYQNSEYDKLFVIMKNLPNGPKRQEIINRMLEIVRHDSPWVWGIHARDFILNQQWVAPSKINEMTSNVLKFQSIDSVKRAQLQSRWNRPVIWPIVLIVLFVLLISLPVIIRYWKKELKDSVKNH